MRTNRKQIIKLAGALTALAASCALVAGGIPSEALLDWGRKAALLSVGMQQPEGGAVALSERLERRNAGGNAGATTTTHSTGYATTQAMAPGEQEPHPDQPVDAKPVIPTKAGDGGTVLEQKMAVGSGFVQGVAIKNASGKAIDIASQIAVKPKIAIKSISEPQVLIVHTHTTEGYMRYYAGYYNSGDVARTTDERYNVAAAGEAIAKELRAAGIGVVHDTTVHDSPKYSGAYDRSAATVTKNLKQYPSIQVVLDIHRDAIMQGSTTKVKPTVTIDGRKAAQVMIITGVVSTEALPHPDWQENLRLSLRLQAYINTTYSGLIRPLSIVAARYNQHLSHGAMLIEVGTDANTVDEAVYSGQLLGKSLAKVLGTLKE